MRQILLGAIGLTLVVVLVWVGSGAELRGYGQASLPGGVIVTSERAPLSATEAELSVLMSEGVALLYEQQNAKAAVVSFTEVLDRHPAHYGARYQVAKALEANGRLMDALHAWRRFEAMAFSISDLPQLSQAQARVAELGVRVEHLEQQMATGVGLLHKSNDPALALGFFGEVLADWPTHYGARYQRAVALERSGKRDEARKAWVQFLEAAEHVEGKEDIQAATEALERLGSSAPRAAKDELSPGN